MTTTTTGLSRPTSDASRWAVAGFLARYREPTRTAYTVELRAFLAWCLSNDRDMLQVTRAELELYLRYLEGRGYRPRRSGGGLAPLPPSTSTP